MRLKSWVIRECSLTVVFCCGSGAWCFSQTFSRDSFGRVSSTTDYLGSTALRWDRDRLAARGRTSTADRWEYRYSARGEVASAWKQFGASVTTPASGEIQAATGTLYAYDDIGNRSTIQEAGRAALSTTTSPTSIDTASANTTLKPTGYTVNALNQYTGVSHPVDDNSKTFFNLRGTRSAGFEVRVNGHAVDATNTALSGYQPTNNGTYFKDQVSNVTPATTTTPDLYEPIMATQKSPTTGVTTNLTLDDPVQYLPPATESLSYDDDGNLLSDARWTYTWDSADRLVKMVSLPFYQPATTLPATPPTTPPLADITLPETKVAGQTVEFTYDAFSRRISKKVTTQAAVPPGTAIPAPVLATWEAYVYDGWNMVATYSLQRITSTPGKVEARVASHVWGPDIGSKLEARSTWQAAGGVGGLLMTLYPSSASGVPNLPNFVVQGPIMDHMGNVTSVLRMDSSAGLAQLRPEFLYDYDAFGKEIRSTALIAGSNPDSFPFHFSTKFTDPESGFNYYGYRFYDPANGRWINRDPFGEKGGPNVYATVVNQLTVLIDVLGLTPELPRGTETFVEEIIDLEIAAGDAINKETGGTGFTPQDPQPSPAPGHKNGDQDHHPIPHESGGHQQHYLVSLCVCNLNSGQPTLPLSNHISRHSKAYHKEVRKRLDDAWDGPPPPGSKDEACRRLGEVIKKLMNDILSGEIDPYMERGGNKSDPGKTTPRKKPDRTDYKPGDPYPVNVPTGGPLKNFPGTIPFPTPVP